MPLISQHSLCDYQLCPCALVCLLDYVQLAPGIQPAKHSAIINRAIMAEEFYEKQGHTISLFQLLTGLEGVKLF